MPTFCLYTNASSIATTDIKMANSFTAYVPDARRIRSYLLRLPLATRGLLAIITALYIAHWFVPSITEWGALIPQKINISTCMCGHML